MVEQDEALVQWTVTTVSRCAFRGKSSLQSGEKSRGRGEIPTRKLNPGLGLTIHTGGVALEARLPHFGEQSSK